MPTDYATKAAEEWCGSDARHSATVKEIAAIIRKHAARTTDPRAARIAELEAALRELASSAIEITEDGFQDETSVPTRRRFLTAISGATHALNSNINSDKETE